MIFNFNAIFMNVITNEKKIIFFSSSKNYVEAWEDAVSYFNKRLLEMDKTWIYSKIEQY